MQRFQLVPFILIGTVVILTIVIFLMLLGVIPGLKPSRPQEFTLEMWGVFDEEKVYNNFIADFTSRERGGYDYITIKYHHKKNIDEYEEDLINALAAGTGPDIFYIHNPWLVEHQDKLYPMPLPSIEEKEREKEKWISDYDFRQTFSDVAYADFIRDSRIYAIPLYVDTLSLYYNKDIFNTVGIPQPPATWEEFTEVVKKTRIIDNDGNIKRAGAAIGTAKNINRSTDILALLILQKGDPIVEWEDKSVKLDKEAEEVLSFYTGFVDPSSDYYTWNQDMSYSIDAFYEGNAAIMLNYSYHVSTIKEKASYLRFEVAKVPQFSERELDINYANYWGIGVSASSEHKKEAWEFILWMSEKENAKKYAEITNKPTSRKDLISWQRDTSPRLAIFADQALSAKSWYQKDESRIEKIFTDMIELVVEGELTNKDAVKKAKDELERLMK